MSCVRLGSAPRRFRLLLLSVLGCALLLGAASASAEDVQIITRAGQKQMLASPGTDAVGARHPDVTIVEYFDYNCPYCKKLVPALQALLAQDPKIAVLYKDWPILGDVSVYAASSALAAGYQGKYQVAHDALIGGPRLAKNELWHRIDVPAAADFCSSACGNAKLKMPAAVLVRTSQPTAKDIR